MPGSWLCSFWRMLILGSLTQQSCFLLLLPLHWPLIAKWGYKGALGRGAAALTESSPGPSLRSWNSALLRFCTCQVLMELGVSLMLMFLVLIVTALPSDHIYLLAMPPITPSHRTSFSPSPRQPPHSFPPPVCEFHSVPQPWTELLSLHPFCNKVQTVLIIHGFHVCPFANLLIFIFNPKVNTHGAFTSAH